MKNTIISAVLSLFTLLLLTWVAPIAHLPTAFAHLPTAFADPTADAVVGDGTPASCTEANFDTALNTVQNSGSGTLTFNCGGPATINFSSSKIIINNATVTIDGGNQITLSGVNTVRHFYVDIAATLTVKNITLANGFDNTYGGGSILNLGVLALDNATIQDSNVDSGHSGGAIMSQGPLTIDNSLIEDNGGGSAGGLFIIGEDAVAVITGSTFRGNRTTSTQYGLGGAISSWNDADVTIHSSTLAQNQAQRGGAIYSKNAILTIEAGTMIEGNTAPFFGGGIYNSGGFMNISDSELTNNIANSNHGGGIYNSLVTINVINTVVSNNSSKYGGGISNSQGTVILTNSILTQNTAQESGGAISNSLGNISLTNVTISKNTAGASGGGITSIIGNDTLIHVTLSDNSAPQGGGIDEAAGTLSLKNVVLNQGALGENCSGNNITSNGFNLSSDGSCPLDQAGDQENADPLLDPLADNGGSTQTHMLLSGSPAIDTGLCIGGLTTDQRELPRFQGNSCDIGALERQPNDSDGRVIFLPTVLK